MGDAAARPSTANNKSSRYWRAGAADGESQQPDLINRRKLVGAWLGDISAPAETTTYESRMRLLSKSATTARDTANGRKDHTAGSIKRRPNSSGVYSLKGITGAQPPTTDSPAVQRPSHSQSLPIFHLSDQQQGALVPQQSNQRDDSTNAGIIRGRPGSGLIRRGTTDFAKPARMATTAAHVPRADSYRAGKRQPMNVSAFTTNVPSPEFPTMDYGIEIYEPPNRVRPPSATEKVSVSPVTISRQSDDANNGVNLPDVHSIAPSPLNTRAVNSLLAGPSPRSASGVHIKPDDIQNAQSGNEGTAHRGSTFTPIGSLFPRSTSTHSRATPKEEPTTELEISHPPPFQKCMQSPLAEKKKMLITPQKFSTSNANKEWTGPVKPILKKSGNGSVKKIVTFDLSENMYSEHVPYVSPPKTAVETADSRAKALAASMRTPLLNSSTNLGYSYGGPGVAADSSANGKDISSPADETPKGSALSIRHRNSMMKYKGGNYS